MKPEDEINELNIPHKEYLDYLVPPEAEADSSKPNLPTNVISLNNLKTLPLTEQVKILLKNGKFAIVCVCVCQPSGIFPKPKISHLLPFESLLH